MPNLGFTPLHIKGDFTDRPKISAGKCIHQVPWFRQAKGPRTGAGSMDRKQAGIRQHLTPIDQVAMHASRFC